MQITIDEAAARLGKSARQVRYLIQNGGLRANKVNGRWLIEADDLPLSEPQRAALGRQERALRGAVERGLGLDEEKRRRYSVRDLKAFELALPLHRRSEALLGADHPATRRLAPFAAAPGPGLPSFQPPGQGGLLPRRSRCRQPGGVRAGACR